MKVMQAYDQTTELKLRSKDAVIHFEEGLIGFSEFKDFVLMENDSLSPFRLLQSLESPQVGFLVLEPTALVNNYYDLVPAREWESLGVGAKTKPLAFVIEYASGLRGTVWHPRRSGQGSSSRPW